MNPVLAWLGVAVTICLGGLVPCVVALVRMRRDVDNHAIKVASLEARADRHGDELDVTRSALNALQTTVAAGFARLEAILTRGKD
jgi:hypothetical protein